MDWNGKGRVKAWGVSTHQEEEFIIHTSYELKKLQKMLHHHVKVTGTVEDKSGKRIIRVRQIAKV